MKVLVLGGDGFCGWPASLRLSAAGHDVTIVDNLSRRRIDRELGIESLTPIQSINDRISAWRAVSGHDVRFVNLDIAQDYVRLAALLIQERPDAVVHFAEQRSAPYSMHSGWHKRYTVNNNVNATHNVLCAIAESGVDAHLVHLGTMGVYGYGGGTPLPEGYLRVRIEGAQGQWIDSEILHPPDPGSVYHMTKTLDELMFLFYNKNDGIRVTDLHQGVVWGTNTSETISDERLANRFDYDGEYGTVLNRFLVQAAIGYPLTVYGTGGQTRAFIHIRDSVECVRLAIESAPQKGDRVRIFNQTTEVHRVRDLAELVAKLTGASISTAVNPRQEAENNDLVAISVGLRGLGLSPTTLQVGLLEEVVDVAKRYAARVNMPNISSKSYWNRARKREAETGASVPSMPRAGVKG